MQLLDLPKTRFWKAIVKADGFRLLQGEDALSDYRFGGGSIHHLFCSRCGVKSFGSGDMEELGGKFYAVNVACLDDATGEELAQAPITYENGWNDRCDQAPLKRATSEVARGWVYPVPPRLLTDHRALGRLTRAPSRKRRLACPEERGAES